MKLDPELQFALEAAGLIAACFGLVMLCALPAIFR